MIERRKMYRRRRRDDEVVHRDAVHQDNYAPRVDNLNVGRDKLLERLIDVHVTEREDIARELCLTVVFGKPA